MYRLYCLYLILSIRIVVYAHTLTFSKPEACAQAKS